MDANIRRNKKEGRRRNIFHIYGRSKRAFGRSKIHIPERNRSEMYCPFNTKLNQIHTVERLQGVYRSPQKDIRCAVVSRQAHARVAF